MQKLKAVTNALLPYSLVLQIELLNNDPPASSKTHADVYHSSGGLFPC
jgi:hypothetical protein